MSQKLNCCCLAHGLLFMVAVVAVELGSPSSSPFDGPVEEVGLEEAADESGDDLSAEQLVAPSSSLFFSRNFVPIAAGGDCCWPLFEAVAESAGASTAGGGQGVRGVVVASSGAEETIGIGGAVSERNGESMASKLGAPAFEELLASIRGRPFINSSYELFTFSFIPSRQNRHD